MGNRLFGVAAVMLGAACLVLRDQLISSWTLPGSAAFVIISSIALVVGGMALLVRAWVGFGALVLGAVYVVFAATFVPPIVAHPAVYASWGDLFYALALVVGAVAVRGSMRAVIVIWGLCNISFGIEQIEFFQRTASLVPAWMPGGGALWSIATTISFVLAGISLVSGYRARLTSQLLTAMFLIFGIAVWIPALVHAPHDHGNWSEGLQTFAIAGTAWIVADTLARRRSTR
jgi:uncharacterized membrane protein YphA (DoxX/SURF4 family)